MKRKNLKMEVIEAINEGIKIIPTGSDSTIHDKIAYNIYQKLLSLFCENKSLGYIG